MKPKKFYPKRIIDQTAATVILLRISAKGGQWEDMVREISAEFAVNNWLDVRALLSLAIEHGEIIRDPNVRIERYLLVRDGCQAAAAKYTRARYRLKNPTLDPSWLVCAL